MTAAHPPATDDHRAALVALSGLRRMGPGRIHALLEDRSPAATWEALVQGRVEATPALTRACGIEGAVPLLAGWQEAAAAVDPLERLDAHRRAGIEVLLPADPLWPFGDDPDPPALLFALGEVGLVAPAARVAIVGTRRCSSYGIEVAGELGTGLAAAGLPVVSGLAAGIDGAAHVGALSSCGAAPVGVVATGLDVVYPRGHRQLWRRVAEAGLLLAEVPLGTMPARWRFPARNRIIAALSAAVVVVESAARGGALHTVDEAVRRDLPVLAVPGPITSRASIGTNRLLAEGALPACGVDDVLAAIGIEGPAPHPVGDVPARLTGAAGRMLDAVGFQPSTFDQLVLRSGLDLGEVEVLLRQLDQGGWIRRDGGWVERCR